ncbi:MAG: hypothetical protein N5P05_000953 [Chroococcopsis gigantea SAG 12.99]|jgi:CHAT domain-containing protein|nr:CHAT domain-containing protein [Chlorogloea purpurea SAG 13.99]MDV2999347.1 hypothetical protein [Chroococcopsis gigantea SAG 12.99]
MPKRRSHFLPILLFIFSLLFCLTAAQISPAAPGGQIQKESLSLVEQGQKLYINGEFDQAIEVWRTAAVDFARRGDKLNQAMALSNMSLSQQQLGRWNEAQTAIAESISILETLSPTPGQQRILASTLDIAGQGQLATGKPQNALYTWQSSTNISKKIGNAEGVMNGQINQAQALQDLGLYPRACQILLDTLAMDSIDCQVTETDLENLKEQPAPLKILALRSLGNTLRMVGQTRQSQTVLIEAWQLAQQSGIDAGPIYLSLGNTLRALGNKKLLSSSVPPSINKEEFTCTTKKAQETAAGFYEQAAQCYRQGVGSLSPITKIQSELNLLALSVQRGEKSDGQPSIPTLAAEIDRLPPGRASISARLKLSQNLLCLQSRSAGTQKMAILSPLLQSCATGAKLLDIAQIPSLSNVAEIVQSALAAAQLSGDEQGQANALGYLGAVYQQMGETQSAIGVTQQALQKLSSFDNPELAYLWQWQLARLYRLEDRPGQAIVSYNLAFQILQSLRLDLVATNPDIQFSFRDNVEPVYRELTDLLLQPDSTGAIGQDRLQKAREIIESLQLAELNNFFQEACLEAKPQPIDRLDRRAGIVYSIVLENRLAVILSIPGQPLLYHETALSDPKEVETTFDDLFAGLNPFIVTDAPLAPNQKIYDWLIRPQESQLAKNGTETLVFVLDGVLRGVPVAALHDGKQYLIQKYNLAVTPGLQLFDPRRFSQAKLRVLLGGLTASRQGFPALPSVEEEVKDITRIANAEVILDDDFTNVQLEKKVRSEAFPIVHLATHGQFSSQAEETFLLTWDERINVKNLDRLVREQERSSQNPIELLILSACQTALGDKRAALGLAGVAVRSGARSTIATLWSVQDESTAQLMIQLYEGLKKPDVTRASALREAQLSLLNSPEYQHPFYWAPFVLVGNWL